jgi:hypothetical protein
MASIISAGTTSGTSLNLSGDTSGVLQLASNGSTTAVTINTSQNVGIGTSSPSARLQVNQTTSAGAGITMVGASANTDLTSDFGSLSLQNTNTTNNNYNILGFVNDQGGFSSAIYGIYTSHTSGSQSGAMAFSTRNAGSFAERMRINSDGTIRTVSTISVGNATPSTSGAGITFPATQSASSDANTLDDYEEGTWTPTLTFSGGSTGITYTSRTARYTKIGRLVYVFAAVTLSNKGSSSGAANVNNLPFSSITNAVPGEFFVTAGGASIGSGFSAVFGTEIYFYNQASTDRQNLNDSNFTNTTEFSFSAVYEV